eukprot:1372529-Amorphochlora_amoeboformis.AAC.2
MVPGIPQCYSSNKPINSRFLATTASGSRAWGAEQRFCRSRPRTTRASRCSGVTTFRLFCILILHILSFPYNDLESALFPPERRAGHHGGIYCWRGSTWTGTTRTSWYPGFYSSPMLTWVLNLVSRVCLGIQHRALSLDALRVTDKRHIQIQSLGAWYMTGYGSILASDASIGDPLYLPPEVLRHGPGGPKDKKLAGHVSSKADVWALGIILAQ